LALQHLNRFRVVSKIGLTVLVGIIVLLASISLIINVASAFTQSENLSLSSPYGWYDGGNTVKVNVTNRGTMTANINATSINGADCPIFSGSNGLELSPESNTTLTITYQNNAFQEGTPYTIKVMTAEGYAFTTIGSVPSAPEFPSSLSLLLALAIIATLLITTIHRRKQSSFLTR